MYISVYVYLYTHMYVCMYWHMYVGLFVCTYVRLYTCICLFISMLDFSNCIRVISCLYVDTSLRFVCPRVRINSTHKHTSMGSVMVAT